MPRGANKICALTKLEFSETVNFFAIVENWAVFFSTIGGFAGIFSTGSRQ